MILTAPIGCFDADRGTVPDVYAEAAPLFDQLNVMSYGMAWDIPGWRSWHTSALRGAGEGTPTSIDGTVRRYLGAGVPAAKLGIGVGLFGLCYGPPVDGPRQALRGAKIAARDHDLSWALVMARYFDPAARRWDEEAQAPYLSFAAPKARFGCTYVSYEDAESIAARAAYVAELGLGGVIVWTINEGHVATAPEGERDPMVEALAEHLLGR
jgi:chitinase